MKRWMAILFLMVSTCWSQTGMVIHRVRIVDEFDEPVIPVSINIYLPDTTTNASIYQDAARSLAITQPITSSSTNTTLVGNVFYWYGPDGYDYKITTDNFTQTSFDGPWLNASTTRIQMDTALALDNELFAISELTSEANELPYFTGSGTASSIDLFQWAIDFLSDANIIDARVELGVAIGSDIQAWDDDLDDIAALSPTSDYTIVGDGADWTTTDRYVFDANVTISTLTESSIVFIGPNGVLSQDNTNLYWDGSNDRLGIGTSSPGSELDVSGDIRFGTDSTGGPELYGDLSGAFSRTIFRPRSGNYILSSFYSPSGTQNQSIIQVNNDSDLSNRGRILINLDGAEAGFITDNLGSGTAPTSLLIGEHVMNGSANANALQNIDFKFNNSTAVRLNSSGKVGINETAPETKLEVLDTSTQLLLTYSDGIDTEFYSDPNGNLNITPSGGDVIITGESITSAGPVHNVKAYGATGDGATDDDAAITAALAATTTGIIYFPAGTYLVDGNHTITNQHIKGAGWDATIFDRRSSSANPIWTLKGSGSISHIQIDGNDLAADGIVVTSDGGTTRGGIVHDVYIHDCDYTISTTNITGVTNAVDAVITAASHGLTTDMLVRVRSVSGMVSSSNPSYSVMNFTFPIKSSTTDTITLEQTTTGGYTAWSSGGTVERAVYAIRLEKADGEAAGLHKKFYNIKCEANYGDLYLGNCNYCTIDNFMLYDHPDDYSIYMSNLGISNIMFSNGYIEGGVRTSHNGIRDVTFFNIYAYLDAAGAWDEPWFQSHGMNAGNGMNGGEVEGITFQNVSISRDVDDSDSLIQFNNYTARFIDLRIIESATTNFSVFYDRGGYGTVFDGILVEGTNAWNMFNSSSEGSIIINAKNLYYTQGLQGTCSWSAANASGETTGFVSVKHSDLNHDILDGGTIRGFTFHHIDGNLDLTNCTGHVDVFNVQGTITDPNNVQQMAIGSALPSGTLDIMAAADYTTFNFENFSDGGHYNLLDFYQSNSDTKDTASETPTGRPFAKLRFYGVDNTSAKDLGASISVTQDGAAGVKVPTNIILETYSSTAVNSNQLVLHNDGNTGFGTATPRETIDVVTSSQLSPTVDAHGGYVRKIYEATSGTLTGATDTIELNIPSGWRILQVQLHVKTAVVDDAGDDTWSAELNDGVTEEAIVAGAAAAQNTNVNHWAVAETWGTLTDAETDILLTPNGGNFTAGEIEAHALCIGFDTWDNE